MEAAGLIEKIEMPKPLRFNFEDIRKLPPPILAFNDVAFSYSGEKKDYLYEHLSFGIEYVFSLNLYEKANQLPTAWIPALPSWAPTEPANPHY